MEWYDNMKKKSLYVLLFLLGLFITGGVKASTCTDKRVLELSSLSNDVKVSYQEYDKVTGQYESDTFVDGEGDNVDNIVKTTYPAYYLTIYNLPKELNVSIIRSDTKKTVDVTSNDASKDGVIYVDTGLASKLKMFTVKIRSNDSSCKNEIMKTLVVTTPMYNSFSSYESCQEYPEFELCKQFTTVDYSEMTMPE